MTAPTTATPVPTAQAQPAQSRRVYVAEESYFGLVGPDPYERAGQANAYCLCCFATFTLCFILSMCLSVTWWFSGSNNDCYWAWVCCSTFCTYRCYREVCSGTWRSTTPITQNELPAPTLAPGANISYPIYNDDAGDNIMDYWSVIVAVACGSLGCIIVIGCTACPAARRPLGPAKAAAGVMLFSCVMHITSLICMAVQFFPQQEGQYVYNYFRYPQYEQLDGESLLYYLLYDKYYYRYGNLVLIAWILMAILAIYEGVWAIMALKADERVTRPSVYRSRQSVDENNRL